MATSFGIQNTFLTPDVIAREALLILENNIVAPQVMSSSATAEYTGAKVGDTIRIRRPAFFGVDTFSDAGGSSTSVKIQDAVETSVNLQIEKHFDVSFEVSSKELAFAVDDFNERLLRPAMSALSQKIDEYALSKMVNLGGLAEADFAAPNSLADMAAIVEKMNKQKIPMTNRKMIVSPAMQSALFSIEEFVRANFRGTATSPVEEASLGRFMGMDLMMSQSLPTYTAGLALAQAGGSSAIDLDGQANADLSEGTTTLTIKSLVGSGSLDTAGGVAGGQNNQISAGDTIRIAYDDGVTRDHVVVNSTPVTISGTTAVGIEINPGLYGIVADAVDATSGGYTGINKVVSQDNVISVVGGTNAVQSYTVGAAFHPSAFQMVFVPQPNPMGPGTSSSTVNYNGMSLRVMQTYDHLRKRDLISVDCLVGVAAVDGRLGVRVPSTGG